MTKIIFSILLIIFGFSSVGQNVEKKVENYTIEKGLDSFYVYSFP
jgi:hypothetical protein